MSYDGAPSVNKSEWGIGFLLTHPIQYIAPLLSYLARQPGLRIVAFYQSKNSVTGYFDAGFKRQVHWGSSLLDGYQSVFLPTLAAPRRVSSWTPINYGLGRILRDSRIDALIVHGYSRPYHWLAMRRASKMGIRVFVRDDAHLLSKERSRANIALKKAFFRAIDRYVSGYLCVGTLNREYYLRHGVPPAKLHDMAWAVDGDLFGNRPDDQGARTRALRRHLGIPDDAVIVLYVGKLQESKGVLLLLDAFERLDRTDLEARLVLVGDGELREEVRNRAASNPDIQWVGFKTQAELVDYYHLGSLLVVPSMMPETWGLVVNEAMSAGKAVLVSDQVGCAKDLVEEGVNGSIFAAGDVSAFTHALQTLISDSGRLKSMGEISSRLIECFSFKQNYCSLLAALSHANFEKSLHLTRD